MRASCCSRQQLPSLKWQMRRRGCVDVVPPPFQSRGVVLPGTAESSSEGSLNPFHGMELLVERWRVLRRVRRAGPDDFQQGGRAGRPQDHRAPLAGHARRDAGQPPLLRPLLPQGFPVSPAPDFGLRILVLLAAISVSSQLKSYDVEVMGDGRACNCGVGTSTYSMDARLSSGSIGLLQ